MVSRRHLEEQIKRWPHVKEKWIQAIMEVRRVGLSGITPPLSEDCNRDDEQITNTPPIRFTALERRFYAKEMWLWYSGRAGQQTTDKGHSPEFGQAGFYIALTKTARAFSAENIEREIAENIFDWWLSKKSYKQWYSEKFEQQRLDL
jgi:hypothetical protein